MILVTHNDLRLIKATLGYNLSQLPAIFKQAVLHVWGPKGWTEPGMPGCFLKTNRRQWAHLCDDNRVHLVAIARRLGVRRIKVSRDGQPGQHIDLCGGPLKRAIKEATPFLEAGSVQSFARRAQETEKANRERAALQMRLDFPVKMKREPFAKLGEDQK